MKKHPNANQKQNLTVKLEKETIRKAKLLAVQDGSSISELVSGYIRQLVDDHEAYETAKESALEYMKSGFHLGGKPSVKREKLHER